MLLNSADYVELNYKTIIEWWNGKNVEWSSVGLMWDTTMVCGCKEASLLIKA